MKKANRSSKIINFKDFNAGYNAVSEREDNIIGQKIADFRAANKMSLTDLRILLEILWYIYNQRFYQQMGNRSFCSEHLSVHCRYAGSWHRRKYLLLHPCCRTS